MLMQMVYIMQDYRYSTPSTGLTVGNSLSTEGEKRQMLAPYVDNRVLDSVAEHLTQLLNDHLKGKYQGPLGVDMMVLPIRTLLQTPLRASLFIPLLRLICAEPWDMWHSLFQRKSGFSSEWCGLIMMERTIICTQYTRNSGFKSFLSDSLIPYLDW